MAIEYPCSVCKKEVTTDAVECEICNLWTHRVCGKLKKRSLRMLSDANIHYFCPSCSNIFPYSSVPDEEFLWLNSELDINEDTFYFYKNCQNISLSEKNEDNRLEFTCKANPFKKLDTQCKYITNDQIDSYLNDNNNAFSLIHFNARSLKSNFCKIQSLIRNTKEEYSVIAISETWFDENTNNTDYQLDEYDMYFTSRTNKRGGGVLLYINKNQESMKIDTFSIAIDDLLEIITIELILPNSKNKIISCVYRTPGSDVDKFTSKIEEFLQQIKLSKHYYLCGDFNIDILKMENNKSTKLYMEMLYSYGYSRPSQGLHVSVHTLLH